VNIIVIILPLFQQYLIHLIYFIDLYNTILFKKLNPFLLHIPSFLLQRVFIWPVSVTTLPFAVFKNINVFIRTNNGTSELWQGYIKTVYNLRHIDKYWFITMQRISNTCRTKVLEGTKYKPWKVVIMSLKWKACFSGMWSSFLLLWIVQIFFHNSC